MPLPGRALILAALAGIACACASSAATRSATPTPVREQPPAAPIALLFDTDADGTNVATILEVLRRDNIRATFSVTGLWAEQHRDLLLAIAAAGHQVVNGGYHGTSFTGASTHTPPLTDDARSLELSRTEVTVYHLTGRSTRPYWRPPHGDVDEDARREAAAAGYTTAVVPTADTAAWPGASADAIVQHSLAAATSGTILALHADSPENAAALPELIAALRQTSYAFTTIQDLAQP